MERGGIVGALRERPFASGDRPVKPLGPLVAFVFRRRPPAGGERTTEIVERGGIVGSLRERAFVRGDRPVKPLGPLLAFVFRRRPPSVVECSAETHERGGIVGALLKRAFERGDRPVKPLGPLVAFVFRNCSCVLSESDAGSPEATGAKFGRCVCLIQILDRHLRHLNPDRRWRHLAPRHPGNQQRILRLTQMVNGILDEQRK